jgi:hypothetical protein
MQGESKALRIDFCGLSIVELKVCCHSDTVPSSQTIFALPVQPNIAGGRRGGERKDRTMAENIRQTIPALEKEIADLLFDVRT